jgi:5'-AMP-activated protein kinase catalytic alpha subunit
MTHSKELDYYFEVAAEIIGTGGQSVVYRATDRETGSLVALKKFKFNHSNACLDEVEILRHLHAQHSLKHVISLNKVVYLEMVAAFPYYKNGELLQFIAANGYMDELLSRTLYSQIVCAINSCHQQSVVHLDIKPENILIDDNFNVVVADFGLAKVAYPDQVLTFDCGSLSNMAPQMNIEPVQYDGFQADVWSLACVLFSMMTGNAPFGEKGARREAGRWSCYNLLVTNRRDEFWSYHRQYSRQEISEELQDFFDRIFVESETERATVDELRRHPWMQRPILTNDELVNVMTSISLQIAAKKLHSCDIGVTSSEPSGSEY